MSQDVFITVQPFTGDQINIQIAERLPSNTEGVLSLNGLEGHVTFSKNDIGLSDVENISILETSGNLTLQASGISGYLQSQIPTGIDFNSFKDLVYITGTQTLSGNKIFQNFNISDYLIAEPIISPTSQTGIYYPLVYLEKFLDGEILDLNIPNESNLKSVLLNIKQFSGASLPFEYSNINWINNPPAEIFDQNPATILILKNNNSESYAINLTSPASTYNTVTLSGDQTITGLKNFTIIPTINGRDVLTEDSDTITNINFNLQATNTNVLSTGENLQQQINDIYSSGFITGVDLSNYYTNDNPSGFITGLDLSSYATVLNLASTGQTLNQKINNLSGVTVLTYGDQYVDGQKIFRDQVRIKDLYVTGTQTVVNTINTNVGSNYLLLNATGGTIDAGIFIVTGDGLTGISDTGAIIGYDVPANRWVFGNASRSDDLSQLEPIAGITNITNYSGFASANYATILNLENTGSNLQNQIDNINNSGFITGVDLSNYYTNDNPSGFITGVDLSPYLTGVDLSNYITRGESGQFYSSNNPSGYITGIDLSNYYTNDNPSGFVTSVNLQKISVELSTGIENYTGAFSQTFSALPSVVGTMQTTGDYMYMVGFNSVTTSGFVADFSDIILETGVKLNIIAYNQQLV